ncbi:hypothetical protein [Maribacter antarcticus]|uniref:hypothetical protein n=1 Tax=Maribacter antarcticus TaxID=505250 RepID=UPI00047A7B09|nr:hypothetical protein [Maribacter antarcticus]
MKRLIFILSVGGILFSCDNNDHDSIVINEENFLIFGHFFGECGGERCVETFKLTDEKLFEDINDDYFGENLEFEELGNGLFKQVNDLSNSFPNQLMSESETILGCPDCADGGGIFIQYSVNGSERSWRIDQRKVNIPSYLHNFIDEINTKITLINNQ